MHFHFVRLQTLTSEPLLHVSRYDFPFTKKTMTSHTRVCCCLCCCCLGNHESVTMNKMYGFDGEVRAKYSAQMCDLFTEVYNRLPLAHCISSKILVHTSQLKLLSINGYNNLSILLFSGHARRTLQQRWRHTGRYSKSWSKPTTTWQRFELVFVNTFV